MAQFNTIVIHERPHLDEICAVWLLQRFGEEKYPGIREAQLVLGGSGGENLMKELSSQELELAGIIPIGVGGGRFDEHPGIGVSKKENECAATLVAKDLGVNDNLVLKKILDFVRQGDLKGGNHPFDLAALVKAGNHTLPNDPERIVEWTMEALDWKYQEQKSFLSANQEIDSSAETRKIHGPKGELTMVVGETSNEEFSKAARAQGAAVVIQRHPKSDKPLSESTQISTNKKFGLKLQDVVAMLRVEEQQKRGNVVTTDWATLTSEGKVPGVEEWYFHVVGQMVLNGSLSAPDTPRSKLGLDQIVEIVEIGLNPKSFEPTRQETCLNGICISTSKDPCPWYKYGLSRCRQVRYQQNTSAT